MDEVSRRNWRAFFAAEFSLLNPVNENCAEAQFNR